MNAKPNIGAGREFLAGGGEMGELMRSFDWSRSPLGPPEHWSPSLRMMVSLLLVNRFPLLLWWGPDYISIYNDAYRPILGSKHPGALGLPFRDCWPEIKDVLLPLIDAPFKGGPATWMEDILLEVNRFGFPEETHFTIAYSPVPDDTVASGIGGVLATVHEITDKVVAERRASLLAEIGARVVAEGKSAEEACRSAVQIIASHPLDVPFALYYLVDETGRKLRRVAEAGLDAGAAGEAEIDLARPQPEGCWPLQEALESESVQMIQGLARALVRIPKGPWSDPPGSAAVIPIKSSLAHRPAGVLIAGISARLRVDGRYMDFLRLMGAQSSIAIGNARAYEDERRRAQALADIDRAKTAFFSNVSHELRTPLTLMLGPIEQALSDSQVTAPVRERLELAHRNALRLQKLVNSLLDFSRIEAGRLRPAFEPVDLAALTREVASTFHSAMEQAGLEFTVDCEALGQAVFVDPTMWEKLLLNLLSNAFKFTMSGGVAVRLSATEAGAMFEVRDTGVGIPAQELPRIFERFYRVEGLQGRTHEGTGIGLSLVQELVKLHGGAITVNSVPGRGTEFQVRVPFGRAHIADEQIRIPRSPAAHMAGTNVYAQEALRWLPSAPEHATPHGSLDDAPAQATDRRFAATFGSRILIADDNADMRDYLHSLLAPHYVVEAVADGEQALAAARNHRPDLLLTDLMMPQTDGLALLKAIRADAMLRDLPVVLLSARAGEEARLGGLDAGADDYLVKPFSARELHVRIGALLELTKMRAATDERFRKLVNVEGLGFLRFEIATGVLIDANDAFFAKFGYTREQMAARSLTWRSMTPPEYHAISEQQMEEFVRSGRIGPYEKEYLHADGSRSWMLFAGSRLDDGTAGEYCIDVGDRRRAEAGLVAADRQKDEFLAMLAHELRNPLASIGNASELLSRLVALGPRTELPLALLKRQTKQLTRLVDDLLDISRIARGRIALENKVLEVGEIIEQAVESVQPDMREKGHQFMVSKLRAPAYVRGDQARLVQAVSNIIHNAAKYTDRGGKITLNATASAEQVMIEVRDDGSGMAPELVPHVFDLFVQSDRTLDRSQGGLGIGLSVVKRLIDLHHGSVHASSAGVGKGSTFTVRLPRVAAPAVDLAAVPAAPSRSCKVLIVEDNIDAADSLAMLLKLDGHVVHTAYSAHEAIEAVRHFRPEVIFLDIGLPSMDGYEVARRIRAENGQLPIRLIALTGYGQPEDRERSLAAGFDLHLVKPVTQQTLDAVFH